MSVHYNLYLKGVFDLVATMVIKSDYMADRVNTVVSMYGEPVERDKRTWKYYLNLAGQYHAVDEMMTVVSTDTTETIEFTRENMLRHDQTRRDYQYGTRYYEELVQRYPRQEALIRGILYPTDIDVAIEADDHTILYYDDLLVEPQEINLVDDLQRRIDWFFLRWGVPGYEKMDPYFGMLLYGQCIAFLAPMILNIRLSNCNTTRAHSFDVRQYLRDNGRLDHHYDYMTHYQRMYFYRNIRYINHNNGKRYLFDELTENVMTHRRFPLAGYTLQTNTEGLTETLEGTVEFQRRDLNVVQSASARDLRDIPEMLAMEQPLAIDNEDHIAEETRHIPKVLRASLSSAVPTKILESDVMDVSEAEPNSLAEVMFNHWAYLSSVGLYRPVVRIDHPYGGEPMVIPAKDAFVLWMYCVAGMSGITLREIPPVHAWMIRRLRLPTMEALRALDPTEILPDTFLSGTLRNNVTLTEGFISVESFKLAMVQIQRRLRRHKDSYCHQSDLFARGAAENIAMHCYKDVFVDMYPGEHYDQWFVERGMAVSDLTQMEYATMADDILREVTGEAIGSVFNMRDVHESMVGLMRRLLSYSVQVISSINSGTIIEVGTPVIRHHVESGEVKDGVVIKLRGPYMRGFDLKVKHSIEDKSVNWPPRLLDYSAHVDHHDFIDYPVGIIDIQSNFNNHHRAPLPMTLRVLDNDVIDMSTYGHTNLPGYSMVTGLDLADLFKDRSLDGYGDYTPVEPPRSLGIDLAYRSLNGFTSGRSLGDDLSITTLDGF